MPINALTAIPSNVVITTGNGKILLTWNPVPGANSYTVQRSVDGGVTYSTIASSTGGNSYFTDTSPAIGTQYWYQVASNNGSGTSAFNFTGTNGLALTAVACLPGQINLGYLRYFSKLKADLLMSQFLTDDEWNFNINQSAFKLYNFLIRKFGEKYFLAPPLQIPTTQLVQSQGLAYAPFPDGNLYSKAPGFFKLAGVDAANSTSGQWMPLPRFNWIDRYRFATLQLAGTVQSIYGLAYCENGSNLWIIPPPQQSVFIQLWYVPIMSQMLQDTDMLSFSISGWSELVMIDAGIKALMKEESFDAAEKLVQERQSIIDEIQETAANRDVGQPNTVSNTRARSGDPNFGTFGGFGNSGFGNGSGWGG